MMSSPTRWVPRTWAASATFALVLGAASTGRADPVAGEFSVHRFDTAPGPRNFFSTRTARSDGNKTWSAGFVAGYGKDPFVLVGPCSGYGPCDANDKPDEFKAVKSVIHGDLLASFTLMPKLQFGLRVPVVYVNGQGLDPAYGTILKGGGKKTSLGDPMVEAKYRFYGTRDSLLAAAGGVFLTAPLGHAMAEGYYIGDRSVDAGLRGIVDIRKGDLFAAVNLVGMYRKNATIGGTKIGSELRYSAAVGYDIGILTVMAEALGNTRLKMEGDGSNGLEALLGARVSPKSMPLAFNLGGGARLVEGVGVPSMRLFAGLLYSAEPIDSDQDGVLDTVDACPQAPEDRDNHEDSDGCPDDDNDGDRFVDSADKCPDQAEDSDGFEDQDGCPDLDDDKDGVPDERDSCRKEPETKNGFKDDDGCPDVADTDKDGVPDATDQCPAEPEDTDGFDDTDGCPDLDNDKDGIPDTSDECSDEAETMNDFEDTDGCPDEDPNSKKKK